MYPNPQEALPFTSRPNLDQYRKLAKELVKACKSDDAGAIRAWTRRWLERLPVNDADTAATLTRRRSGPRPGRFRRRTTTTCVLMVCRFFLPE